MRMSRYAILAVALCLGAAPPAPPPVADEPSTTENAFEPIQVRFRLADGVRVRGELTGWDDDGIDGSFARRAWTEIHHDDVWKLYRRIMDRSAPLAWIDLGRTLLVVGLDQPDANTFAERAFKEATRLAPKDPVIATAIENARIEVADEKRLRQRIRSAADAERLRTESPEARTWTPQPWPKLDADQRLSAVQSMRADAADILERAGLTLEPVETKFFLFYSDMSRRESQKWARQLDEMYYRLADRFDMPKTENIFWGKAVIFVFKSRDRFRLVEAEAFGQLAADWADGLCHPIGPKVFVNFYRQRPDEIFAAILVHETVHGFMHRYRLPTACPPGPTRALPITSRRCCSATRRSTWSVAGRASVSSAGAATSTRCSTGSTATARGRARKKWATTSAT